ncbi:MAG TPA: arsenate reductase (glutaredoxin) [Candidatus Binatia bacterium]|jgi:arsenate reductase
MSSFEIFHNPRCSKSRETLQRLHDAGVEPVVTPYLEHPPTRARLDELLRLLGLDDPRAIMRTGEPIYAALGLSATTDRGVLLDAICAHPVLLERPIVVRDERRAVIGRPPSNVDTLLPSGR